MAYQDFYELEVRKLTRQFKKAVVQAMERFPQAEQFELKSQLLRAARSVQANIAEGHGRQTPRDEARFLAMARGSLSECLNHLIEAFDSGYIEGGELAKLKVLYDETGRALNGYMRYVKSKIPSRPGNDLSSGTVEESRIEYGAEDASDDSDFLRNLNSENNEQSAG
jgi:four helix bundle protein